MSEDDTALSVGELVEYCQTQARLLWGRVETLDEETDEILTEIDDDIADVRTRLDEHSAGSESATDDTDELEALESELEERQAVAEAKQARRTAFQELASAYLELAEDLDASVDDGEEALTSIVHFEHEHDAPAYFEDRQTILEAASDSTSTPNE
ncbi:hypothetical protein [Haloarcula pellucida]|uniref:Uncharacterized protein n=1 Tax=Haloarcula pellucida TaxID=1427151 RepID=A0A830GMY8_9EURY|nr:hypothetical protein [Halomicroarcula pellucida]MBX0349812.1 hypothetical protein [Halomicroarcula pellucida]GGN94481.1 hypothetical protein GCM10009030_20830 [Halomicroarcula pellucida]